MRKDSPRTGGGVSRIRRHWHLIVLGCLVLFHVMNNWVWLSTNVAILNSDARRHLMTALTYSDMLQPFSLDGLFDAVTMDEFRPPLFPLTAVPLVWLFGRSTDVATMVNAMYVAVLLGATYAIGRKIFDKEVALLAAFVLSTFPAIYGMSRYFYIDFALTAVVALNIALLLYSENFERKGCTLAYGVSLGLGMLVKWTFVVFALPPAVLVLLRSGVLRQMPSKVKSIRLDARWAVLAALLALGGTLVWYLPNLGTVRRMFLGLWLLPLCWVSLAVSFYALSRPSARESNLFGAVMVGSSVASIWYLPRIDFLWEFLLALARHSQGALGFSAGYFRLLVGEQLSAFYLMVLGAAFLIVVLSNRRWRAFLRRDMLTTDVAVTGSWAVLSFCVFSFRASNLHSRYTMPMLPPLALLIAAGLLAVPWKKLSLAALTFTAVIGLAQFFALSYDRLDWLRTAAIAELPAGRPFNLFAHGFENQLPDSGVTDSRYWIMPEILKFMREECSRYGREGAELGILMKTHYVQASTFELVSMVEGYPELTMRELARAWSDAPVYPQLFQVDYLVLKDGSQKGVNREETRELVPAILSGESPFLSEVFGVAEEYPLPDSDTVYLYRKKYHLQGYDEEDYRALARDLEATGGGGEAIVFEKPEQVEVFARHYQGSGTPCPLPREHPLDADATVLDLETIAADHDMIFAVLWEEERVDPGHFVEDWLNRHGYRALTAWYGPVRLVTYASPLAEGSDGFSPHVRARFGETIVLSGYSLDSREAKPGQILRVTLSWKTEGVLQEDYKIFLHLLDAQGQILAQQDSLPVGGSVPTTSWVEGEIISDNHGVFIPWGTPQGEYRLVLGLYELHTGQRLPVISAGGIAGDELLLTRVTIEEG